MLQARGALNSTRKMPSQEGREDASCWPGFMASFPYFITWASCWPCSVLRGTQCYACFSLSSHSGVPFAFSQHQQNWIVDTVMRQNLLANPKRRSQTFKKGTELGRTHQGNNTQRGRWGSTAEGQHYLLGTSIPRPPEERGGDVREHLSSPL